MGIDRAEVEYWISNYHDATGERVSDFVCPITRRVGGVLCNGHIINDSIKGRVTPTVIQRKDVDEWYGGTVEAGFVRLINSENADDLTFFSKHASSLRAFTQDGKELGVFVPSGDVGAATERFPYTIGLKDGGGVLTAFRLKSGPGGIVSNNADLTFKGDFEMTEEAAVATLYKSAFLALWRWIGYRLIVSPAGDHIRKRLATFYFDHASTDQADKYFGGLQRSIRLLGMNGNGAVFGHPRSQLVLSNPQKPLRINVPHRLPDTLRNGFVLIHSHLRVFAVTVLLQIAHKMHMVTFPADDVMVPMYGGEGALSIELWEKCVRGDPPPFESFGHTLSGWITDPVPVGLNRLFSAREPIDEEQLKVMRNR